MSQLRRLIASSVLLALPALTLAQSAETPEVPAAPAPNVDPGYGYPPPYPFPPPGMMPPGLAPWDQGPWGGPPRGQGGYPGWREPEAGGQASPESGAFGPSRTPGAFPMVTRGQLRITREVTDDAYVVRIAVGDGKTGEVQVTPMGRSLAISLTAQAEAVQEDTFGDGRGYQRSFSFSHGSTSRRIGLPPDADLAQMTRQESDGTIVLRIPRSSLGGTLPMNPGPAEPPTAPAPPTTGQ